MTIIELADGKIELEKLSAEDILRIAYLPPSESKQTVHIRPPGALGGKHFDSYPFSRAIEEVVRAARTQ